MRIKDTCPQDSFIVSPKILLSEICSFTDEPVKSVLQNNLKATYKKQILIQQTDSISLRSLRHRTKKRDQQGLKKLIKQQKIKMIVNRFAQKIKINNIYSQPIIFQPYEVQQRQSIYYMKGFQLPDVFQKILSIIIVIYIMICLFIDTTASLYPQILNIHIIKVGQFTALVVFLIQLLSSCTVVKMIQGKKVQKISQIFSNYLSDGFFIDFAYLIILIISFFTNVGNLRLIILMKVPECFQRMERIENTYINTFYKQQYWGLAKVFLLNFILSHFLSLLLVLIGEIQPQNSWLLKMKIQNTAWYQQYIWGYYWGTTIMLTVGFGDVAPANYQQAICIVIIQTFSCLALAYNINCVGNLISNLKSQDVQKNRNIKTFKILSSRNNISEDLQMKIHNYIEQSTNIKKKFNFQQESKFISTLPSQLKADFLKESNKKIFQTLVFFKNLTEKTLLALSQVIQMKICHPQQVIKKRGQISGIIILKQGKIGFCTKLIGSSFSNVTIDKVKVQEKNEPFLLSLDFISLDRSNYQIKSQEYSILYYLNMEQTLDTLKMGQMDYQHFCFLKDRCKTFSTQYQVFQCQFCKKTYHTKFNCPKLHYCPLKKHIIDKYLFDSKISRNQRFKFYERSKAKFQPFKQLDNNLKIVELNLDKNNKFISWKKGITKYPSQAITNITNIKNYGFNLKEQHGTNVLSLQYLQNSKEKTFIAKQKEEIQSNNFKIQHQMLTQLLKDQITSVMIKNNDVWLMQCDELKNYKFYFSTYNPSTLAYLNKQNISKSLFS